MSDRKIKVGQLVWIKRFHDKELLSAVVSKVGRRYFFVETKGIEFKIEIFSLLENTDFRRARVYLNDLDYKNEVERGELEDVIRKTLSNYPSVRNLSLDKLRRIVHILNEEK